MPFADADTAELEATDAERRAQDWRWHAKSARVRCVTGSKGLKHGPRGALEVYVERRADVHEIRLLAQDGSGRSIVEADPDV